jgi:hypothetical protein
MADQESEKLCAKLTGVVADVPADEFYNQFNLDGHSFSEYYFKDMQRIFHLEGMDHWPTTLNTADGSKMQIQLSLVCFSPIAAPTDNSREAYLVSTAKEKVVKMFLSVCKQNSFLLRCFYVYIFYLIRFFFTSLFSPKKMFYPDIIRMFSCFFVLYRS